MPFDIKQAFSDIAQPERQSQRLVEQLAAQREQELQWKKDQTALYEELVKSGAYGKLGPDQMLEHLHGIWGDHKGNKDLLKQHGENVSTIHKGLNAVMSLFGPGKTPMQRPYVPGPMGMVLAPGEVTPTMQAAGAVATKPGTSSFLAPPPAPSGLDLASSQTPAPSTNTSGSGPKVGDTATHQGKRVRIRSINPDGTAEIEDIQ